MSQAHMCLQCGGPLTEKDIKEERGWCEECRDTSGRMIELSIAWKTRETSRSRLERIQGWSDVRELSCRLFNHASFCENTWERLWDSLRLEFGHNNNLIFQIKINIIIEYLKNLLQFGMGKALPARNSLNKADRAEEAFIAGDERQPKALVDPSSLSPPASSDEDERMKRSKGPGKTRKRRDGTKAMKVIGWLEVYLTNYNSGVINDPLPTQAEIARTLGVSESTVSRVGRKWIREHREKIKKEMLINGWKDKHGNIDAFRWEDDE